MMCVLCVESVYIVRLAACIMKYCASTPNRTKPNDIYQKTDSRQERNENKLLLLRTIVKLFRRICVECQEWQILQYVNVYSVGIQLCCPVALLCRCRCRCRYVVYKVTANAYSLRFILFLIRSGRFFLFIRFSYSFARCASLLGCLRRVYVIYTCDVR